MVLFRCWLTLIAIAVLLSPLRGLAAPTEKTAFEAAARAFQDRAYARADGEFGEFIRQFTNSTRIPEAVLFQAEARIMQTNYSGAIELLSARLPQAGNWADAFRFWLAEANLRKGDNAAAADQFAAVVAQFPSSARRLDAGLGEVTARSKLQQWPRVIELLQQTNGFFQIAARANPTNDLALRGYLLLGEAHLAQNQLPAAEAALRQLSSVPLGPRLAWHREFLSSRILAAKGDPELSLPAITNLLTLASNSADVSFVAESIAFQGAVFERLKRFDDAMRAYERNLADGFPAERQTQALLKIASMALARNHLDEATRVLERFCAQDRNAPSREQALLTLGELRLRQHLLSRSGKPQPPQGTNAPAATNHLTLAVTALDSLVKEYPQSALSGKAWLNLGWCYWEQTNMEPARLAFARAAETLPQSLEQATALYKLGDAHFRLGNHAEAVTNYSAMLTRYEGDSRTREELFEPALYQLVRSAIEGGQLTVASDALDRIIRWFPTSFHTERAVLLVGPALAREANPAAARTVYLKFAERAPDAPLLPQVRLAIARTFEQEGDWKLAIDEYDSWVNRFTNSPTLRPRAEYLRAWSNFQAGRETNAFLQFTNFVARFETDKEYTPLALWWLGDYYFKKGNTFQSEYTYQLLFRSTNWQKSDLSYQAQIMAARIAMARQGWNDASNYLSSLTRDAKLDASIWAQATLAYGNLKALQGDYNAAAGVYDEIVRRFPTNPVALLALGEKANCLLQWGGAQTPPQLDAAAAEYQKLITNTLADCTVRAIARIGLGTVLEAQAQQKTGAEQQQLLRRALNSYLDVFYLKDLREGENPPDPFWIKKAALEGAEVAERLQDWPHAIGLYERLLETLPAMKPVVDKKLARAQASLLRPKP